MLYKDASLYNCYNLFKEIMDYAGKINFKAHLRNFTPYCFTLLLMQVVFNR